MTTATGLSTPVSTPVRIGGLNVGRAPWLAHAIDIAQPLQVDLTDLIDLLGGTGRLPIGDAETLHFSVHRVGAGAMLVHEGAHAELLYVVQSGSFKSVKTAEDGYEHVLGFAWRGDVLGFDGLHGRRYAFAAVALEDSRVVAVPLAGLDALRHRVGALDTALQMLMSRQLTHAGEIAEVMAAVSAEVRLARFLVQLSARMAQRGQSPRRLRLRMNRRDIANHLGLAHETISRSFRMLSERGWLRVDNREVEILDLAGLKRSARSTRGMVDEEAPAHQSLPRAA